MVNLSVVKHADKAYVFCGISNKIKYSIIITNTGTTKATCVKVKDLLGEGACFIPGTMTINGCKQNILGLDYLISIGAIPPGGNTIITFDAQIVPGANIIQITNQAIVTYCDEEGNLVEVASNVLVVPVVKISVCMQKTVDKEKVLVGEVMSYSIMIRNMSNVAIDNVVFEDQLSSSLEVQPASVTVNGMPQYIADLSTGISLGTLQPQSSTMVSFQAEVISYPPNGIITNCARVEYEYTIVQANIPTLSIGESCSNIVTTSVVNETITC